MCHAKIPVCSTRSMTGGIRVPRIDAARRGWGTSNGSGDDHVQILAIAKAWMLQYRIIHYCNYSPPVYYM